jgi:glycine/D-amino acid oxidase-like deaminating enzyme
MADQNLWNHSCAERFDAPLLSTDLTADLLVIGGGFTGCAAALEAARQGAKVVLLEAQTIGFGGSGRNVGLVNAGLWLPPDTVCDRMGQGAGDRLNAALAAAPDAVFSLIKTYDIQCEPVRNGTLHCAHSKGGLDDLITRYEQHLQRGAPVQLLDAAQTAAATGSDGFYGALRDMRAGTIQPLAYARGLARAAREHGAQLYQNTPVLSLEHRQDWHARSAQGSVRAKAVILATNAYCQQIEGTQLSAMTPVNFFQLATQPLPADVLQQILPQQEGCWDTGLVMTSFRRDQAGRLILGAMGLPDRLNIHKGWAQRALTRLFPQLRGQSFTHFWSGRIGMSADYIAKIQHIGPQGYAAYGYSGRGIGPGTVLGTSMTQAVLSGSEEKLPIAPSAHQSGLFNGIKGLWIESGARVIHALDRR